MLVYKLIGNFIELNETQQEEQFTQKQNELDFKMRVIECRIIERRSNKVYTHW